MSPTRWFPDTRGHLLKVTKSDLKVASSEGTDPLRFDREAGAHVVEHSEKYRMTGDLTIVIKINGEDEELPSKLDLTIGSNGTNSEKVAK